MPHTHHCMLGAALVGIFLTACSPVEEVEPAYDPSDLRFSGERAFELETEFVRRFPYRHSGQPNNLRAAEWLIDRFEAMGLECQLDTWTVINYSRPVSMNNAVCVLLGESPKQIVLMAHLDQYAGTVEGADDDASGVAVLLHLGEVFSTEPRPRYTLVFIGTDAEEYGMIGSERFIDTHPDPESIIAGMALDTIGKSFYDRMNMEIVGRFRSVSPIWLQHAARDAARSPGNLWVVNIPGPIDQVLAQAVPVSFMDQGPMVAAGVPAIGLTGGYPPEFAQLHWETYHNPDDTLEYQSADSLHQSGRIAEALVRHLQGMDAFPDESGPYMYFDSTGMALRGVPLWGIFAGFVAIFLLASFLRSRAQPGGIGTAWPEALPHFLSYWLPLLASVLVLYALVELRVLDAYHVYPGTSKDPVFVNPRWPGVIIFLGALAVALAFARRWARRSTAPAPAAVQSLGLLGIGLAGVYIMAINPFSLLFVVPILAWIAIRGRKGLGRVGDILLFLAGGLVVYVLFYFFAARLHIGLYILWFVVMMFSIGMVSFPTAAAITAILAAGLSMITDPPLRPARAS